MASIGIITGASSVHEIRKIDNIDIKKILIDYYFILNYTAIFYFPNIISYKLI
tara:strand:+ start:750 stop:908 length:159 start_codon:yes stop_codon:yes gene_type:complete